MFVLTKWSMFYTFTYYEYIPSLGLCKISGQLEYYKDVVAMVMFHDITFLRPTTLKTHFSEVTFHKLMHLKWSNFAQAQYRVFILVSF